MLEQATTILQATGAVFLVAGIGAGVRAVRWVDSPTEQGMTRLLIRVLFPALILAKVAPNPALGEIRSLALAPVVGFLSVVVAMGVGALLAKPLLGAEVSAKVRSSFAVSVSIPNYAYLPIPLILALYPGDAGDRILGVLFVHNVGVELAIWTVAVAVFSGKAAWSRVVTPVSGAIVLAVLLNVFGLGANMPSLVWHALDLLGAAAVPCALLVVGMSVCGNASGENTVGNARLWLSGAALRLGLFPLFLLATAFLPMATELKQVLLFQAAMPAAMFPIVLAKHYGGEPRVAFQVTLATSMIGFVTIPAWLLFGSRLLGL